jgi:hypothetical protein
MKLMETLIEYLNSHGFYFASNDDQKKLAKEACKKNILQPIGNLVSRQNSGMYVRAILTTKYELPAGLFECYAQ